MDRYTAQPETRLCACSMANRLGVTPAVASPGLIKGALQAPLAERMVYWRRMSQRAAATFDRHSMEQACGLAALLQAAMT